MSEFQLQNTVNRLLHASRGGAIEEKLVEHIQQRQKVTTVGCTVSVQQHLTHLTNLTRDLAEPDVFLSKYNDLKQKNVDCLDSYMQLLDYISQNSSLKKGLLKNLKKSPSSAKSDVTKDNLPQVKNLLKKAVKTSSKNDDSINSIMNISSVLPVAYTPSVMSWVQRRPNMSWDFSTHSLTSSLPTVPSISQENILIVDLLNILVGLPGSYIEPEDLKDVYGPRTFKINDNVSLSMRELVKQIVPLASHYSIIQRFTEEKMRFEYGQVNNALAEAMQQLINDHLVFISQLESEYRAENLTLQKMWFFVQRNMQSFSIAANIASSINKSEAIGGKVLSLLHDNVTSSIGDDKTRQLCLKLMESACAPYMTMLGMWIYRGIISDPIKEFLIEDNEVVQREEMPVDYSADYWEKRYCICRERIPKFLESVSDMILKTGKYLNVIRQCGKPVKTKVLPIEYKIEEMPYIEAIENAYNFASQTLLDLVIQENDLIGRLKSVKHYFLLDQGDFIVTFLTLCEKELGKYVADVNQGCIESLMDLALRLSSAINDPYKDDLRAELLPYNLQLQMCRILSIETNSEKEYVLHPEPKKLLMIESFSFGYEVHWPLSLILNRKSLACYQMIFRHLFYCKYIERRICQVWRSNKVAKKFHYRDGIHYRAAFALRQRMLHYIQNLEYHMMVEVIEPHWCTFLQKINKVNNVDEILSCHSDFLNSCLKDCMLTIPNILNTIIKLLAICEDFCIFMQQECNIQGTTDETSGPAPSFKEKIFQFDVEFSGALMQLLNDINQLNRDMREHDRLLNLLHRLDFNSYYIGQIERLMGSSKLNNSSG